MSRLSARRSGSRERSWLYPALWAAVIAVTFVVSSGAVLLAARVVTEGSRPAPPAPDPITTPIATPIATPGAGERAGPPGVTPGPGTSRLVIVGPRRVVDSRAGRRRPADVEVPLPGVPRGSTAVLLEVSILKAAGPGRVTLTSGDEVTPVLNVAGKGARTSATVVARLTGDGLTARTEGGGDLVVTLTAAFEPAVTAEAGRILPVPPERALRLVPGRDGNRGTIDPRELSLAGTPHGDVGALLLAFQADVGAHGGEVAVGPSRNDLDQRVYWGATRSSDRTRRGFLVVPVTARPIHLYYHAGTILTVEVVGLVTGESAPGGSAGLSVVVEPTALPPLTLPADGRAEVDLDLPGIEGAEAALVTTATTHEAALRERSSAFASFEAARSGSTDLDEPRSPSPHDYSSGSR